MPCTAPALLFLEVLLAAAAAAAVVVVAAAEEDFGISQIACCVTILRGVTCTGDVPKELRVSQKDGRLQDKTVGQWDDGESVDCGLQLAAGALPATSGWGRRHKMTYVCTEARAVLPGQERGQAARQAQDQGARGLVAKVNWSVRVQTTHARARTTRTRTHYLCACAFIRTPWRTICLRVCLHRRARTLHHTDSCAAQQRRAVQRSLRVDNSIPPVFRPAPDLALALAARRTC